MRNVHKELQLHTKIWWLAQEKAFKKLLELWAELATFVTEHFYLKEQIYKLCLFRLQYMADIF